MAVVKAACLAVLLFALSDFASAHNHDDAVGITTFTDKDLLRAISRGFTFVLYTKDECGWCKKLRPEFEKAAKVLKAMNSPVTVGRIECDYELGHHAFCVKMNARRYPTMYMYKDGRQVDEFNGERTKANLIKFIEGFAPSYIQSQPTHMQMENNYNHNNMMANKVEKKKKKKCQRRKWFKVHTTHLKEFGGETSLDDLVSRGNTLVFYTEKNSRACKSVKPIWRSTVDHYINQGLAFVQVVCDIHEHCAALAVTSTPALVFYPDDISRPLTFRGPFELDDVTNYVIHLLHEKKYAQASKPRVPIHYHTLITPKKNNGHMLHTVYSTIKHYPDNFRGYHSKPRYLQPSRAIPYHHRRILEKANMKALNHKHGAAKRAQKLRLRALEKFGHIPIETHEHADSLTKEAERTAAAITAHAHMRVKDLNDRRKMSGMNHFGDYEDSTPHVHIEKSVHHNGKAIHSKMAAHAAHHEAAHVQMRAEKANLKAKHAKLKAKMEAEQAELKAEHAKTKAALAKQRAQLKAEAVKHKVAALKEHAMKKIRKVHHAVSKLKNILDDVMGSSPLRFIKFCGMNDCSSKGMNHHWGKLARLFRPKKLVRFGEVNCHTTPDLCGEHQSTPSFSMYSPDSQFDFPSNMDATLDNLSSFVSDQIEDFERKRK